VTDTALDPGLVDIARAPAPARPAIRLRPALTTLMAWRNLAHDRIRFVVTLVGVLFAVVLMAVQSGLLFGFATTASGLIDHAGADIWIVSKGASNVDQAVPITERRRFQALSVPGVAAADKYLVQFAQWQRPDGGSETINLVGFDPDRGVGGPWNLVAGSIDALKTPDSIIIDELYREKLGITRLGQTVEINGHRARVVGFSRGIRAFTQSPYVFASFKTAQTYAGLAEDKTKYVLLSLAPGSDRAAIARDVAASMPGVDVFTAAAFSRATQRYWLFTTGAGMALVIAAVLGLIVGVIVVAQTLYASTVDRLPEYATLRAMGASNRYLRGIIVKQAMISAGLGYGAGLAIAALIVFAARDGSAAMLLPWPLAAGLGLVTVAMCTSAALISIRKVTTLCPTSVFR
jgi:putative ABC transport system permease protein